MIEKTLKTTKGKIRVKIPSYLDEVTLGQTMQLQDKPQLNDLDAVSILSGIPVDELQNVQNIDDFQAFEDAIISLSDQIKNFYNSDQVPDKITFQFDGRNTTVKIISNLSIEPAGAFMASRDVIAEEINEHIKLHGEEDWKENFNPSLNACCHILAHYFYCKVTGEKYNEYKAEEFCEQVKQLKVAEAMPIAKYFFTSYPNLWKPKISYWHRFRQLWKKRRVLMLSVNSNT